MTPADADSVLAVGAVDITKTRAGFSSHGPTYDGRIKPDIMAMGAGCIIAPPWGGINPGSGTSFAAPLISGMTACLLQANPNKSPMELFAAIKQSSDRYSSPDTLYGYGIPDFCVADTILSGISNFKKHTEELLSLSPNPFHDALSIQFISTKKQRIIFDLYDMTGRKIYSSTQETQANVVTTHQLAGLHLPAAIYILSITTAEHTYYKKIAKE